MRVDLDIPDELLEAAHRLAADQGTSLDELVVRAIRDHLTLEPPGPAGTPGWRAVFGAASPEAVAEVDRVLESDT